MKAIVLSAGFGKRLRPLTYSMPKTMISLSGKPILQYIIEDLKDAGCHDIGIVVSHLKEEIIGFFGDGSNFGVKISYFVQDEPNGTAGALLAAKKHIDNEPFLLYLGDTLIPGGISSFTRACHDSGTNLLMVAKVSRTKSKSAGTIRAVGDRVTSFEEKSSRPTNLASAGVYYFNSPTIFHYAKIQDRGKGGEFQITDVIQQQISKGETVRIFEVKKYIDTGSVSGLLEANRHLLGKGKRAEETSFGHKTCKVVAPCYIGKNCVISSKAKIGPYVTIGHNSIVSGRVVVSDSILMEGSRILYDGKLEKSVVGRSSVIKGGSKRSKLRSVVSDDSIIEILDVGI